MLLSTIHHVVSRLQRVMLILPLSFWILCGGTFVNRLGMLIKPFLAMYLTSALHLSPAQVGVIVGLPGAASFLTSLLISLFADRFNQKFLLVGTLILSALLLLPIAFLTAPVFLGIAVFLWSIFSEAPGRLSRMIVMDLVGTEQRRQAISLLRTAINVGIAVSTAIGGFLARVAFLPLFLLDAGTTILFALLLTLLLPAVLPLSRIDGSTTPTQPSFSRIWFPLRNLMFLKLWIATFFSFLLFSQLFTTFATYISQLGGSPTLYGLFMSISAAMIFLEFPLTIAMRHVLGSRVMMFGCLISGVAAGLCGLISEPIWLIIPVVTFSLASMLISPSFDSIAVELAPSGQRGNYQGTLWLANGLGNTLGPLLGGILLQISPQLCWTALLVIGILASLVSYTLPRKHSSAETSKEHILRSE